VPVKNPLPSELIPNRVGDVFDRHMWVDAMLVDQVDPVAAQPTQRVILSR
jgi:hypothetical protein